MISTQSCCTNERCGISARHVLTSEWRAIGMRHVVVKGTSQLMCLQDEKNVDKGVRGRWRNTPLHINVILAEDFRSHKLKVSISHASVVFCREVFGEVIGKIFSSVLPVEAELFLSDATLHPVEAHVKIFGAFPAHVSCEDDMGSCVVSLDWIGRLRMSHFNQGHADGNSLLAVEEYCTSLSLGGRCHDNADGLSLGDYWADWGGSRPDGERGGECRSDSSFLQHDCVIWAKRDTLRHCQCGGTCCYRENG